MIGFRRRCINLWLALSVVWVLAVVGVIAGRLEDQVRASRDLARDIAALDCAPHATCRHDEKTVTRTADLVGLMIEYRATLLLEVTFLPPLGALGIVLFLLVRHRRAALPA